MTESTDETPDTPEETLDSLKQQVGEWKEIAQRKAAEAENIKRRALQEKQALTTYAAEHLITRMLPVLDDLHSALNAAESTTDADALRTGIQMIYTKAKKIFEDAGVKIIEGAAGEPFDVDYHEALMHMPSEVPEGHIVQIVQRGYALHDKVLRHAKVITSAGLLSEGDSSSDTK